MHWLNAVEQQRHNDLLIGNAGVQVTVVEINRPQYFEGDAKRVAQSRDIAGHRAISEGYQRLGPGPYLEDHLKVFMVGNGAFDEHEVNVLRIVLDVRQGA